MRSFKVSFCVLVIVFIFSQTLHAQTAPAPGGWVAQLVSVEGSAQLKKAGEAKWSQARLYDKLYPGDMLRVMDKSRAAVVMSNQSNVRLDENTTLTFKGVEEEKTILLDIFRGAAHFFNRVTRTLKIFTPYVNGIVQGTEFLVKVDDKEALISIFEGRIAAENDKGSIIVNGGQTVIAKAGQAPMLMVVVKPRDAVQWALYYPSIMDFRPEDFSGTADWQDKVRKSVEAYRKGDLAGANEALSDLKDEGLTDTRYLTYRATLALSVGRLDEASAYLERTVKAEPNNANAYALQSIIAVVQNRKDDATNLARKATSLDPKSPASLIAQSYAQQARFDINGATASVQEAVKNSPNDAYARARLAELWLSQGYLDRALEEANRAVAINPNLARTQIVLGYAYLTQVNISEARAAFEKAIALDSADPLARLGLGLAKIRKGDLNEGRKDIEIAASLDVNNSLIRSYLGKAYYEEKREKLSKDQFQIAKQLDPMDPTPWFYDAILKQSVNRPVEALEDMQKSIELNDNRAVYRSKLLLDSDMAARSASQARIYNDLGFQQLALAEGWKSVNTDPTNYSAHRMLADSLNSLPRHQVAAVSELLQSQMLQPLNLSPIQPQLAESNLRIIQGTGPSSMSFNEYNPLFVRNGVAFQADGIWGQKNTLGNDAAVSGLWDRFSFSAGQFYYKTNGFRENNDQEKSIYDLFFQGMLTSNTSVLAEARYKDDKYGDLPLRFDPNNFDTTVRQHDQASSVRLGLRHALTPNSDLLLIYSYQKGEFELDYPLWGLNYKDKPDGNMGEAQYLFRSNIINVSLGGGGVETRGEIDWAFTGMDPYTTDYKAHHYNVYLYTYTKFPQTVTWTLGVSADWFKETDFVESNKVNPKFGVTWNITPNTTLRAAAFRTLKRYVLNNATLEPTQIAGFNQFFDDTNGVEAWRYGIGIDQKFSNKLFGGVEISKRDLDVPFWAGTSTGDIVLETDKWKEKMGRAYLFWAPISFISLSAEYYYEKFERGQNTGDEAFTSLTTHTVPLGITFFHPSGLYARSRLSFVSQNGTFIDVNSMTGEVYDDSDRFWVLDGAIGYRLPKRFGAVELGIKNITDKSFHFQEMNPAAPTYTPERFVYGKIILSYF